MRINYGRVFKSHYAVAIIETGQLLYVGPSEAQCAIHLDPGTCWASSDESEDDAIKAVRREAEHFKSLETR